MTFPCTQLNYHHGESHVTYTKPQLKRLGSLSELTLGNSGIGNDGNSRRNSGMGNPGGPQ
jgi:hypothetical protein